jgi:hypothetical protein
MAGALHDPSTPKFQALLREARKRADPKFWALLVEIHLVIAAACGDSDSAAEVLILDYLQSLPEEQEPPCCIGHASSHPITGRPIRFAPHTWGTDNGRGLRIMVRWPDSQIVGTQAPVPLESSPDGEISNTNQIVHRMLVPFGALPEGRYTNDLVRLPRSIIPEILRFGGLPVPPKPTSEELVQPAGAMPDAEKPQPVTETADAVAGKSKRPPSRKGRAWPTLLALLRAHPKPVGVSDSAHAAWLAEKQDPKLGKPTSAKTFKNLMPQAMRELADEARRNSIPRDTHPKKVSRGITPGKTGKA